MSLFSGETPQLGEATTVGSYKVQNIFHITFPLVAATANTVVFVAPAAYKVVAVREVHGTASASGTVQLEKLTGTQASGAGTVLLGPALSTATTANTTQTGVLLTGINLAAGDRLGVVVGGTGTGLANGLLQISLARL